MSRPKVLECKKQFSVMLKPSIIQEIDYYCKELNIKSRSDMMCRLIENGIETIDSLDRLGIIKPAETEVSVLSKLRALISLGNLRLDEKGELKVINN
jgi:hypothetical protein